MKSSEIREKFLRFFEAKNHKVLPSASLIPKDPTVLLTLAGMLPFKGIFLGKETSKYKRITTCQKCMRMVDIENVGKTSRHHTFFEMLGNFSFGDYFKKEAIEFAWELLTEVYSLPKDKLLIAVYEKDDEAFNIWNKEIGVPEDRIYRLGEDNNFWKIGDTGPCGPCSEIYYDFGEKYSCGKGDCKPGCDCERYLEIWNLVFIQYNLQPDGKLLPLKSKGIDTGMGLERITRVLQRTESNFDTDLFKEIIEKIRSLAPKENPFVFRVIADHIRAAVYMIADGIFPSSEKRGYVLKRLIRRIIMFGKKIEIKEMFLSKLAPVVISLGEDAYPELREGEKTIVRTLDAEEIQFNRTYDSGMEILEGLFEKYKKEKTLPGKEVFKLHDTYGFPYEITEEIASENGFSIRKEEFEKYMEEQREKARSSRESDIEQLKAKYTPVCLEKSGKTKFLGYGKLEDKGKIVQIFPEEKLVVLDKTPFYPQGGGQVGDAGIFKIKDKEVRVLNTFGDLDGVIFHLVENVEPLKIKEKIEVVVDKSRRKMISAHHTATHLLHAALRKTLGEEIRQSGSFVSADRLRFDYNWDKALTVSQIEEIEKFVNKAIKDNIKVEICEKKYEDAVKMGAIALFQEKYKDKVRVIKIGDTSCELCGGCHATTTGDIKFFKIIKEESLQAGIRRIEAVVGQAAKIYLTNKAKEMIFEHTSLIQKHKALQVENEKLGGKIFESGIFKINQAEVNQVLSAIDEQNIDKVNKFIDHLRGRVEWLLDRNQNIEREIARLKRKKASEFGRDIREQFEKVGNWLLYLNQVEGVSMADLRMTADEIKNVKEGYIIVLVSKFQDKVLFLIAVDKNLPSQGIDAQALMKILGEELEGKGGGNSLKCEGGGKNPEKVDGAFQKIKSFISQKVAG